MAFSLYASLGSTTTQLNDGNPFWLENAQDLSGAEITRYEQSGPLQGGATDLGFRIRPREMTLNILFYAATDAVLDAHRDTLMAAFKPLEDVHIFLSMQRDDGEIRTMTCHTVDDIAIELVPEHRPGHLHRARLKLRAATPLWRANSVTQGSAAFTGLAEWWLAGGAISAGSVKVHVEYPAQGDAYNVSGGVSGNWAVAVVTAQDTEGTAAHYIFEGSTERFFRVGTTDQYSLNAFGTASGFVWPLGTAYNYHVIESLATISNWWYLDTDGDLTLNGTDGTDTSLQQGRWRSNETNTVASRYVPKIRKAAIWVGQNAAQLLALAPYMLDTVQGSISVVNDGDVNAYPLMTLRGPVVNPIIVNQTAGGTINLTGVVLGSTDVWTIDLRDGNKQIYDQAGANQMAVVTNPISLANFYLAPSPIAAGGTNVIVMTPGSVGSAAYFTVEITNQYMSF